MNPSVAITIYKTQRTFLHGVLLFLHSFFPQLLREPLLCHPPILLGSLP
jgi:hypothetical protein